MILILLTEELEAKEVRVHEEIDHNRLIAEKLLMRSLGSLEHPTSKWLLSEIEKGNEVVLEVSPLYYSTWDYRKKCRKESSPH
jgi:hypothetical protein